MALLETTLSNNECLEVLREQIQRKRWWHHIGIFAARTSRVFGMLTGCEFVLEARCDMHSKQMRGRLIEFDQGTRIEYLWRIPFWSNLWGSHEFDDEEIMDFLKTWLRVKIIAESGTAANDGPAMPLGNSGLTKGPPSVN